MPAHIISPYKPPFTRQNTNSPLFAFVVCVYDQPFFNGVGWRYKGDHSNTL